MRMNRNCKAFLDMIAWSEGTLGRGDNGYNVLVGGDLFEGYADHPRKKIKVRDGLWSTAAGRYQILARNFDFYSRYLGLKGFGPASQDAIAMHMLGECHALEDIDAGRIERAVRKCASRWASFPGAGYNQPERSMAKLLDAYTRAGGTFGPMHD